MWGPWQVDDQGRTNLRRYFETGSALFVFIWSRKIWKSNGTSAGVLGVGDAGGGATCCAGAKSLPAGGSVKATAVAEEGSGLGGGRLWLASSSGAGNAFSIESISANGANKNKQTRCMIHELVKQR